MLDELYVPSFFFVNLLISDSPLFLPFLFFVLLSSSSPSLYTQVCDIYNMSSNPKNVHVALTVKVDEFWDLLIGALSKADQVSNLNKTKG